MAFDEIIVPKSSEGQGHSSICSSTVVKTGDFTLSQEKKMREYFVNINTCIVSL